MREPRGSRGPTPVSHPLPVPTSPPRSQPARAWGLSAQDLTSVATAEGPGLRLAAPSPRHAPQGGSAREAR